MRQVRLNTCMMQEQITSCSIIFDDIVEHLPVYGATLAKIKVGIVAE